MFASCIPHDSSVDDVDGFAYGDRIFVCVEPDTLFGSSGAFHAAVLTDSEVAFQLWIHITHLTEHMLLMNIE